MHALGGIAAQRVVALPAFVVGGELLLDVAHRAFEQGLPRLQAFLAGQPQAEFGARRAGHRRPHPFVAEFFEDRMHRMPPLQLCQASAGGGTIERPVAASTIEPAAGQYIRQAVQPG